MPKSKAKKVKEIGNVPLTNDVPSKSNNPKAEKLSKRQKMENLLSMIDDSEHVLNEKKSKSKSKKTNKPQEASALSKPSSKEISEKVDKLRKELTTKILDVSMASGSKYNCAICDYHTERNTNYLRHLCTEKHHSEEAKQSSNNLYHCPRCHKITKYTGYTSIETILNGSLPSPDDITITVTGKQTCNGVNTNDTEMISNPKSILGGEKNDDACTTKDEQTSLVCPKCGKGFTRRYNLVRHRAKTCPVEVEDKKRSEHVHVLEKRINSLELAFKELTSKVDMYLKNSKTNIVLNTLKDNHKHTNTAEDTPNTSDELSDSPNPSVVNEPFKGYQPDVFNIKINQPYTSLIKLLQTGKTGHLSLLSDMLTDPNVSTLGTYPLYCTDLNRGKFIIYRNGKREIISTKSVFEFLKGKLTDVYSNANEQYRLKKIKKHNDPTSNAYKKFVKIHASNQALIDNLDDFKIADMKQLKEKLHWKNLGMKST